MTRRHGIARLRWWVGFGITFWAANLPPFTALFFVLDFEAFVKVSALYIADVSIIALSLACGSWYESLRVEQHQRDDADVREVLDAVTDHPHGEDACSCRTCLHLPTHMNKER